MARNVKAPEQWDSEEYAGYNLQSGNYLDGKIKGTRSTKGTMSNGEVDAHAKTQQRAANSAMKGIKQNNYELYQYLNPDANLDADLWNELMNSKEAEAWKQWAKDDPEAFKKAFSEMQAMKQNKSVVDEPMAITPQQASLAKNTAYTNASELANNQGVYAKPEYSNSMKLSSPQEEFITNLKNPNSLRPWSYKGNNVDWMNGYLQAEKPFIRSDLANFDTTEYNNYKVPAGTRAINGYKPTNILYPNYGHEPYGYSSHQVDKMFPSEATGFKGYNNPHGVGSAAMNMGYSSLADQAESNLIADFDYNGRPRWSSTFRTSTGKTPQVPTYGGLNNTQWQNIADQFGISLTGDDAAQKYLDWDNLEETAKYAKGADYKNGIQLNNGKTAPKAPDFLTGLDYEDDYIGSDETYNYKPLTKKDQETVHKWWGIKEPKKPMSALDFAKGEAKDTKGFLDVIDSVPDEYLENPDLVNEWTQKADEEAVRISKNDKFRRANRNARLRSGAGMNSSSADVTTPPVKYNAKGFRADVEKPAPQGKSVQYTDKAMEGYPQAKGNQPTVYTGGMRYPNGKATIGQKIGTAINAAKNTAKEGWNAAKSATRGGQYSQAARGLAYAAPAIAEGIGMAAIPLTLAADAASLAKDESATPQYLEWVINENADQMDDETLAMLQDALQQKYSAYYGTYDDNPNHYYR